MSRGARKGVLRVLCVAEPLPPKTARTLYAKLDPDGRGDLVILPARSPREVIEGIERFLGQTGRDVLARTKTYMTRPTLVEQPVQVRRWWRYGLGAVATAAAVFVLAAFGLSQPSAPDEASKPVSADASRPRLVAPPPTAELGDGDAVVLSAQAPADEDEPAPDDEPQVVVVPTTRPTPVEAPTVLEDVAPLEVETEAANPVSEDTASSSRRIPEAAVPTLVAPGVLDSESRGPSLPQSNDAAPTDCG